jgi:hypothetical protein
MSTRLSTCETMDRILVATRVLAALVVPALITAFIILYLFPGETGRRFAWPIGPQMSAMMLGATYLGGAYFFVMVIVARSWNSIKLGLLPVSAFAAILGVATILHWGAFTAGHIAFFLWALLYFTLPFVIPVVWFWNRAVNAGAPKSEERLFPTWLAAIYGALGVVLLGAAIVLFFTPQTMIDVWPWTLSQLTSRVMAAMFALAGGVALGIALVHRDTSFDSVGVGCGSLQRWLSNNTR